MKKRIQKLKEFFAATVRFPGAGVYLGGGRYIGFKPSLDRYGLIINMGFVWIMFITYDFIASSENVMKEVMDKRRENSELRQMYSGRTPRRIR